MSENTKKKLLLMGAVLIAVVSSDNDFALVSDTGEKTVSLKFHNDLATFDFSDGNMIIRSYPNPVC